MGQAEGSLLELAVLCLYLVRVEQPSDVSMNKGVTTSTAYREGMLSVFVCTWVCMWGGGGCLGVCVS